MKEVVVFLHTGHASRVRKRKRRQRGCGSWFRHPRRIFQLHFFSPSNISHLFFITRSFVCHHQSCVGTARSLAQAAPRPPHSLGPFPSTSPSLEEAWKRISDSSPVLPHFGFAIDMARGRMSPSPSYRRNSSTTS